MNVPDADLLDAALAAVGLARRKGVLRDSAGRSYMSFRSDDILENKGDVRPPWNLPDFLSIRYFEHYGFPKDFKIVVNPFCGMPREELELKLAVMGK